MLAATRIMPSNLITLFVPAGLPQLWKDGHKAFAIKVLSRTLQCLLAIIVIILYAVDLAKFSSGNAKAPAAWIYAEFVATLSLLTCALHYFYTLESTWWIILDFVLCILWSAQAGYFGIIYLGGDKSTMPVEVEAITNYEAMKAGAAIGLVCVFLWLMTFIQSLVRRCTVHRKKRATRKRIDRTIETVEAHRNAEMGLFTQNIQAPARTKSTSKADNLPTYKEATTEQALAKQREALGVYDIETVEDGRQVG